MVCIDPDYALTKPTYLRIRNMIMHNTTISPRSLLSTRINETCMSCTFRKGAWISYACPIASCRKLCQTCSNDRMVSERTLKQHWKVSSSDITKLRKFAFRYHAAKSANRNIRTLIPRACVLKIFNYRTWPEFLAQTSKRWTSLGRKTVKQH